MDTNNKGIRGIVLTLKNIIHLNSSVSKLKEQVTQTNEWLREIIKHNDTVNEQLVGSRQQQSSLSTEQVRNELRLLNKKIDELTNHMGNLAQEVEKHNIEQIVYSETCELILLQKINIKALLSGLFNDEPSGNERVNILGYYAKSLAAGIDIEKYKIACYQPATYETLISAVYQHENKGLVHPYAIKDTIAVSDTTVILNTALVKIALENYKLQPLTSKVKSNLVLVVQNQAIQGLLSASWDDGFSGLEKSENAIYSRWYVGQSNKVALYLNNNSDYNMQVDISFYIDTLDTEAEIEILINGYSMLLNMSQGSQKLLFAALLRPGVNELKVNYYGKYIVPCENARKLKFCISDLTIREKGELVLSGERAHQNLFSQYNPYNNISDETLREILHTNGFFEIESYNCNKDSNRLNLIAKTRYLEPSRSYYFVEGKETVSQEDIVIYIARRKGRIAHE